MSEDETEPLRLFVALELPRSAREALLSWRAGLLSGMSELRPVAPEALHSTLCFLGSQPAAEVEAIAAACRRALRGSTAAELGWAASLWLPPRRPRVLAVRLDDGSGALAGVQGAVSTALSEGGWYRPEARRFLPHVTVARVPAAARVHPMDLPPLAPLTFRAAAVTVYRSRLHRSGVRYQRLASVRLTESDENPEAV